jgi:DNA-binding beta-propeller fold protein YncE
MPHAARRIVRGLTALVLAISCAGAAAQAQAQRRPSPPNDTHGHAAPVLPPQFQVDPFWPKPLPNNWIIGQVAGVAVDRRDHIWIVHRPRSLAERQVLAGRNPPPARCCVAAPPVLVFDMSGNLLRHWGGPGQGYEWPESEHGIYVDANDHVWLAGNGPRDHQILKFTLDGRFLMQIGRAGASRGSNDTQNLNRPADAEVDAEARELYVADGYGNRRIVVFDSETGAYKRHWDAYGERPHDDPLPRYDPAQPPSCSFGSPVHCVRLTRDGLVYICDRVNNRVQVFRRDGTFVHEFFAARETRLNGAVADLVPSRDAEQRFLFSADNTNSVAQVIRRADGEELSTFGRMGRYAGQFMVPHNIAADSQGNLYISEVDTGQRVQRFRRVDLLE